MSIIAPINLRVEAAGIYPTGSAGSYGTAARVRLKWDFDYTGITGTVTFRVQIDDGALSFSLVGTTTTLEIDATGLPVHVLRTAQVRAEHSTLGNSTYTQLADVLTSDAVPTSNAEVPDAVNLQVGLVSSTSVLLTWEYAGFVTTEVTVAASSSDGGAGASAVVTGLARSVTLTGLTAGKTYTFDVATYGEYALTTSTLQTYGAHAVQAYAVMAAPDDAAPLAGPTTLALQVGVPAAGNWNFVGSGRVVSWALTGAPVGIAGALLTPTIDKRLAQIDGIPTAQGVYAAIVSVLSAVGLVRSSSTYPVRILVTGGAIGGCLSWFHSDANRVDLQIEPRGRNAFSYASPESAVDARANLQLTRGERQRAHIIPRDAAGGLISTTVVALGMMIRLKDRRDGVVLFSYFTDSPVTESIGGHTVPYIDIDLESPNAWLEQIFTNLNRSPSAESAANSLECEAEVTLQFSGGAVRSCNPFPVTISQDLDR